MTDDLFATTAESVSPRQKSWRTVPLGSLCSIRMGETIIGRDLTGDGIPVFSANTDLKPWGFTSKSRLSFNTNSVVIGARGSIGFARWPNLNAWTATQTTIVLTTRDPSILCPAWLHMVLTAINYKTLTAQQAIPMITVRDMAAVLVSLPPMAEQQRITERLTCDLAAIAKSKDALQNQQVAAGLLRNAFLRAAFQPSTRALPPGWRSVRLPEIVRKLATGPLYDRSTIGTSGLIPVIDQSLDNIHGYHNDPPGVFASPDRPVVTFANHTCAVRIHDYPFSVIQNVFPLEPTQAVLPDYLYWVLQGRVPQSFYGGHWPKLVVTELPLPPVTEQRHIADLLKAQINAAVRLQNCLTMKRDELEKLPHALLRAVFAIAN